MKPTPAGWPRLSVALFYDDPAAAIDWLVRAFGFEIRLRIEEDGGGIAHSELLYGEALVMVSSARPERAAWRRSPKAIGGFCTQSLMLFVDDVDAHCAAARAAGATIATEPATTDYGPDYWIDRGYEAIDCEGHHFWFIQRVPRAK